MALMEGDTNRRPRRRLTAARLREGVTALSIADRDLATVVARFGEPPLWSRRPGYATLVPIILEQQVSPTSALATYNRLHQKFVEITPSGSPISPNPRRVGLVSRVKKQATAWA